MYGVFSPTGKLVAAFEDFRAADAMARYDWKTVGERLYWSIAPQAATITRIAVTAEPPGDPHLVFKDEGDNRCSSFDCPRHGYRLAEKATQP